jgi:hypothetical protein
MIFYNNEGLLGIINNMELLIIDCQDPSNPDLLFRMKYGSGLRFVFFDNKTN